MRLMQAAVAAGLFVTFAFPTVAQELEQATIDLVLAIASKGYAHPADASMRNVKKSLAANGMGYCGEITIEATPDNYTAFHILLETANGPSVLRLAEFNAPETDPQSAAVHRMMKNFGCIE